MSLIARLSRPAVVLALALASWGCGAEAAVPTAISFETAPPGIQAGYVKIESRATGLVVDNQTERPIYLMVANAETLALMYWAPCTGGANCLALAQGQQREIPYTDALAYEASTKQYAVYWWNVIVQADGTPHVDNMHNVTVTR
jgi:hypothetical protein